MNGRLSVWMLVACVGVVALGLPGSLVGADRSTPVVNGSFDNAENGRLKGWSCPAKYEYRPGEGRNGTGALAFENDVADAKPAAPVTQDICLEPGRAYRISFWARNVGLLAGKGECGGIVGLEWWNAAGRHRCAYAQKDALATVDWYRYGFDTPVLDADTVGCRLIVSCGRPSAIGSPVGKIWFDDVTVDPVDLPPVQNVVCDAYRAESCDGVIRFLATLNVDERSALTIRAELVYLNACGETAVAQPDGPIADGTVSFVLSVADLKMGRQCVRCILRDGDGRELGSAETAFTRVAKATMRRVEFDRLGRTLVGGKPFFPVGMFCWEPTPEEMSVYLEGDFNCVMPYVEPTEAQMDWCHEHNLKLIYSLKHIYAGHGPSLEFGVTNHEQEVAYVTDKVLRFKDHPALLAWYSNDEFEPGWLTSLKSRQDLMERLDPQHPTWTVMFQVDVLDRYVGTYDNLGTDPYPVPSGNLGRATTDTLAALRPTRGLRPAWQVPQAMDWKWFRGGNATDRYPTRAELRTMSWQMIAAGANGLIYYAFHQMRRHSQGDFDRQWADLRSVVWEIRRYERILLAGSPPPPFFCKTPAEKLPIRIFAEGRKIWVLLAEASGEPATAEVQMPGVTMSVKGIVGDVFGCSAAKDRLTVGLPPWGFGIVRIR